ncbi:MAG: hypothetical protein Q9183_008035, partial [Haloplaca sp. 2 TL-2023]
GRGRERENPAIYIHCSVSTTQTLSPSALTLEAEGANASVLDSSNEPLPQSQLRQQQWQPTPITNTASEPLGFDRLASAGLSPSEITSLRSQFLALTAHTHTPDTMPSPLQMRRLEERWLDSSAGPSGGNTTLAEGGTEDDEEAGGALEDMLWGNLMGFFWPVGAAVWLCREEGVWSKRRQVAVVTGLLVNLAFGLMRMGGG